MILGKFLNNKFMVEIISIDTQIISIIIRNNFKKDGIEFFTPNSFSQQLGYMFRKKGYIIEPHIHNIKLREINLTQEVLYIKSGKVRIDFFNFKLDYLESKIVTIGDVVLLASGGHGFEFLEESEIIEIKQGPYIGDEDKLRFENISIDQIKFK